jgi:hypothetical protein
MSGLVNMKSKPAWTQYVSADLYFRLDVRRYFTRECVRTFVGPSGLPEDSQQLWNQKMQGLIATADEANLPRRRSKGDDLVHVILTYTPFKRSAPTDLGEIPP